MQFLEWVGEDTKCPYCEGLGSILCDVCDEESNGKLSDFEGHYALFVCIHNHMCRYYHLFSFIIVIEDCIHIVILFIVQ